MSTMGDVDYWLRHLLHVERSVFVLARPFGVVGYDFDFEATFACAHPAFLPGDVEAVARVGPIADYRAFYEFMREAGVRLVNDPEQSARANDLRRWYPALADLTPRSIWFDGEVEVADVPRQIGFPIFVKTVQQTLRHRRDVCIANDVESLQRCIEAYRADPVLGGQTLVFREFVELAALPQPATHAARIPGGRELRTFWWKGSLVASGAYWSDGGWSADPTQHARATRVAERAAERLDVPFAVIDVALRVDGTWIVIEANDAQECGFAGLQPRPLWQAIIERERR